MCGGKVAIPPIVKEKRRNSEKRKEKSRDAARSRRSKESEIFSDLSSQLPLSQGIASSLDKASIMRLSVGVLKVRELMKILAPSDEDTTVSIAPFDSVYAAVLNGFLLVLSEEGDIIYLSENVEEFLGIPQVEMMGHSVYDFSHPYDHEEIKAFLASTTAAKPNEKSEEETVSFFVRMKSTIKSKSRTVNLKSSTYQVIHYTGHKYDNPANSDSKCPTFYLIFIGNTIPHPKEIDVPLYKDVFISRHSLDMKFTHVDERVTEFLGFKNVELLGKSVYSYHHALDTTALMSAYQTLFSKGQCETGYYRFLSKYGGYIWVLTQATLIYDNASKPECVVCLNYVLSKVENKHEIVSEQQELIEASEPLVEKVERPLATPPVLLSSTSAIFAPKETVMSKDFLNFPDTDILLFQEPLKDSKLNLDLDLFPDDPCTLGSNICDDPFISYRDDSLSSPSYCGTPESSLNLHTSSSTSPNHFSTTPSTPESGSLSDIPSLDPIDEFSNLDLKFTMPPSVSDKDSDCYDEELDFRAPFIPSMDDDFPLISPSSSVMWGPQEPTPKKKAPERLPDPEPQRISPLRQKSLNEANMQSSLAALLQSKDLKKMPQTKDKCVVSRKDNSLHKRWQNSSVDNNKNSVKQRNFATSRSYSNGNSGSGHIIMLDSIPVKKQTGKSNASQKRNGQTSSSDRRSNSPPYGSHTATVKVNDRLIKVQVSVSELTTAPIEHKQPFPSPPDPPPKRASPSRSGPAESPKRLKVDNGLLCSGSQGIATDSVLLNLLISGEDASRGYLCSGNSRYSEIKQYEPAVLSLPSSDSCKAIDSSSSCTELLASESELLDSFLKISQYDAEVNAPIQSSHLLQGDDLLSALDHPILRNVPALV